jgi:hypothetical protein
MSAGKTGMCVRPAGLKIPYTGVPENHVFLNIARALIRIAVKTTFMAHNQ